MFKRVCWKKGMRLTDEILKSSNNCTVELVGNALALAATGRFGLIPSSKSFEISLNFSRGIVDVETLNCIAVTKGGDLIDVHYDTNYTNTFDTRVQIPVDKEEKEFILTIDIHRGQWREIDRDFEAPAYTFSLISPNIPVPSNSLPIAHIVYEYDWQMDDLDFVPPCLFVSSHHKYKELVEQLSGVLSSIDTKARELARSKGNGKNAIRIFWPIVQQLMITIDKEKELLTPMALLSIVQKCVSAFTCACELDEYLRLADAEQFSNYVHRPYNYKNVYQIIKEGLELCFSINQKMEKVGEDSSQTIQAPTIAEINLHKKCTKCNARIPINNYVGGAIVYYTTDGSEPTVNSKSGEVVQIDNVFNNSRKKEVDKVYVIKVMAILDGISSEINTYTVTLQKDIERWVGIQI